MWLSIRKRRFDARCIESRTTFSIERADFDGVALIAACPVLGDIGPHGVRIVSMDR